MIKKSLCYPLRSRPHMRRRGSVGLGMEGKVTTWELAQGKRGLRYLPRAETSQ